MNEELKKSLLLTAPAPLLGLGLIAPLLTGCSLLQNAVVGLAATCSLILINIFIAFVGDRIPANVRSGIAILIAGGVLTIAKTSAASLLPLVNVPLDTLAPLLMLAAVIAADTGAYAIKKRRFVPVVFDGVGIGLIFTIALCVTGGLCALAGRTRYFSFFSTGVGVLFVMALGVWGVGRIVRIRAGKETV